MSERNISIDPIAENLQQQVIQQTRHFINTAADYYNRSFSEIPVIFDLTGRAAGMYRVRCGQRVIRYNPYIFAKYYDDNFTETVPHEVAHYVTDVLFGLKSIRPHGAEWKSVMQVFGVAANRTANYDLAGVPKRQHKLFNYSCGCRTFELTSRRHNKVVRGTGQYQCLDCGGKLSFIKGKEKVA